MMPRFSRRLAARAACLALLAAALPGAGCQRPPDEAWLRFLGFAEKGGTTSLALLEGKLRDGTTDAADALFENRSASLVKDAPGTGILVYRARVEYRMARLTPPAADYTVNLFVPAAASGSDAAAASTATLAALPLATARLKRWLIDTRSFENALKNPTVDLSATVTFFALADDGTELQTTGGISISLTNAQ